AKKPLFVFVGRFTSQKGLDLFIEVLPKIVALECNIAILGEGEGKYHDALKAIADKHHNIDVAFGYDEALSHRMYSAADFFLMPSLFEPCGLAQMIAMHYGAIPLVHHVGGLIDTVHQVKDFDPKSKSGYGIAFTKPTARSLISAFRHALALYENKRMYNKIARHNMRCDFSWQESAKSYHQLYQMMIKG
ncbi:MAG: glycosyltransferase, partial [Sulfurovum sp.]